MLGTYVFNLYLETDENGGMVSVVSNSPLNLWNCPLLLDVKKNFRKNNKVSNQITKVMPVYFISSICRMIQILKGQATVVLAWLTGTLISVQLTYYSALEIEYCRGFYTTIKIKLKW